VLSTRTRSCIRPLCSWKYPLSSLCSFIFSFIDHNTGHNKVPVSEAYVYTVGSVEMLNYCGNDDNIKDLK
jgi:hypothetical protein